MWSFVVEGIPDVLTAFLLVRADVVVFHTVVLFVPHWGCAVVLKTWLGLFQSMGPMDRFEPRVMFLSTHAHSVEHAYTGISMQGVSGFTVDFAHKFQEPDQSETSSFLHDRLFDEHIIVVKDPALLSILKNHLSQMGGKPTATVLEFEPRLEGEFLRKFIQQLLAARREEHCEKIRDMLSE